MKPSSSNQPSEAGPSPQQLKAIKRRAKKLSREDKSKTYMQHLDAACHAELGLSRFQDAQKRVETTSPISWYLQACQESYLEL